MEPLISIIIPVYNVEKYLKACVDSVINQTYKNLEILLIDDGSTDKSGKLCDEYKDKDSRIKVIHKENGGLSDARNKGLDIVSGDYIGFIDGDDFIHPFMYEKLLNELISNDCDFAECGIKPFKDGDNIKALISEESGKEVKTEVYSGVEIIKRMPYLLTHHIFMPSACTKLYKAYIFDSIKYPLNMQYEDAYVFPEILMLSKKVAKVSGEYYFYYQRDDSITHSKNQAKVLDHLYVDYHTAEVLRKNGFKEECAYYYDAYINAVFWGFERRKNSSEDFLNRFKEHKRNYKRNRIRMFKYVHKTFRLLILLSYFGLNTAYRIWNVTVNKGN